MNDRLLTDYNIFLIGFMGVGKSTVADRLAQLLDAQKMEMDELIVSRQGMPVAQIFAESGEEYFRDLESGLLVELQESDGMVVSCGGGVVLREENAGHMKRHGRVIWLTATPETIFERVKDSDVRPILNHHMNVEFIKELLESRFLKYQQAADLAVATDGKSADEICGEILLGLKALV